MHVIAKELNISTASVYNYLHKYGIPTRPQKETFTFKGRKHSFIQCQRIGNLNRGKKLSEDTKRKISNSRKGKFTNKTKYGGHSKKRHDGYIKIYVPSHPFATKDGYVMEHILVMEEHIGRFITRDEVVHHKNRIRNDNRLSNLELMTFKEHARLHMKERYAKRSDDLSTKQSCSED